MVKKRKNGGRRKKGTEDVDDAENEKSQPRKQFKIKLKL
jgi:hypothetical protein